MKSSHASPRKTVDTEQPAPLPASIRQLIAKLQEKKDWKPAELVGILKSLPIEAEDLMPWADFDHPVADSYGRKMVHQDENYEVMVMSWAPGDFSTIHDHGYTQWGAVKVFGPAEHATFRMRENKISTLRRWRMEPGDVVGVSHDLLHQMGNPLNNDRFLTMHVYGLAENRPNVTGDARLMELYRGKIQRVNGGVFFGLSPREVAGETPGITADFPTRFRHLVELARRLRRMQAEGVTAEDYSLEAVERELSAPHQWKRLLAYVRSIIDDKGHISDRRRWDLLMWELRAGARLIREGSDPSSDRFEEYAEVYDKVIGQPCIEAFTASYLRFFQEQSGLDLKRSRLLSLGVGTGLTERYLIKQLGMQPDNLLGVDKSAAMVELASRRLPSRQADLLRLPRDLGTFDVLYSGLNVLQYLPPEGLETAIAQAAGHLRAGGYFVGDFIAPNHIEQYPNAILSADKTVLSLRTPQLVQEGPFTFQLSAIINVDMLGGQLYLHDAGRHRRYLPSLDTVRSLFERHFGPEVRLYDAYSLEELPAGADRSPSTRYVLLARKKG